MLSFYVRKFCKALWAVHFANFSARLCSRSLPLTPDSWYMLLCIVHLLFWEVLQTKWKYQHRPWAWCIIPHWLNSWLCKLKLNRWFSFADVNRHILWDWFEALTVLHELDSSTSGYVYMDLEVRHLGIGKTQAGILHGMLMDLDLITRWPQQARARSLGGECHLSWLECHSKILLLLEGSGAALNISQE